jgi:hypothetical protein
MRFIPSVQDYLENLVVQPWMNNGAGSPNRCQLMFKNKEEYEKFVARENYNNIENNVMD